jgi:hypothetical protein
MGGVGPKRRNIFMVIMYITIILGVPCVLTQGTQGDITV